MIKRFIKKAIQDIPQQLSRSVDFYPGTAETTNTPGYDGKSDFKREWNLPEGWKDNYSQQSDNFNSTLTTNISRGASKEQLFQVMSREHPNLTHEQFEELLKHNPQHRIANSKVINEIVDKIKGTNAVDDILESESPDQEINIEVKELGNGAVAETLPNGTILINDDIEEVDDFIASRLVHELSHYVDWQEENYLDRPEERDAFTAQIQYLLEVGNSREDIHKMLLPIFEAYKGKDAEESLDKMIEQAKDNHKKASNMLSKIAQEIPKLTFTQEEADIIEKIKKSAEELNIKAFLAGGLIRDKLLGIADTKEKPSDIDIVTNRGSERLAAHLATKYGLSQPIKMDRSGATMLHFGEIFVDIIDAEKVFSSVKLGTEPSLEQGQEAEMGIFLDDSMRRDLTINSLMYGLHSGKLYDPTKKGLSDIKNKVIRTIIDPMIKWRLQPEDIIRTIRMYSSKPGFSFAPGMLEAMKANVHRLAPRHLNGQTSSRRIERELRKCDTYESWAKCKAVLAEIGAYKMLEKEIKSVNEDKKGNIKYTFEK